MQVSVFLAIAAMAGALAAQETVPLVAAGPEPKPAAVEPERVCSVRAMPEA